MSDAKTLQVYDEGAAEYAAMVRQDPDGAASLEAFVAALPQGAHVLDLGCGPGTWAQHLMAAGFRVDAIDASAGMVAEAARLPGLNVRQARFDEIEAKDVYDGIWANFSLLHAPKAEMPGHLARLARALIPGGVLHIGLKQGTGESRDSLGRFYAYYSAGEVTALLAPLGLSVREIRHGAAPGFDGVVAPWFTLLAHG